MTAPDGWRLVAGISLTLAASCTGAAVPVGGAGTASPGAVPPTTLAALEREVLAELNEVRASPPSYAREVEALLPHFEGRVLRLPGDPVGIRTQEGAAAVREAAAALRATSARPTISHSAGMSEGARDLVEDQGPRGATGHTGSDGATFSTRVNRYGRWVGRITESISYGPRTAADVVRGLLVDDGVPDRGHRTNLLDPGVRVSGIACGPHRRYGVMCVIDLAAGYEER